MQLLQGHTDRVRCAAYSPDGLTLATGSNDATVRLWGLPSGRCRLTLVRTKKNVYAVAYGPGGALASAGGDKAVTLWDEAWERPRAVLRGHTQAICALAFGSDGSLASAAGDRTGFYPGGEVIIWDLDAQRPRSRLPVRYTGAWSLAWAPDGRTLALGTGTGLVLLWDHAAPGRGPGVEDGSQSGPLAEWLNVADVIEPGDRRAVRRLTNRANPLALAFAPDGRWLASTAGWSIRLWEPATGRPLGFLRGHRERVVALAADPNGRWLASAGRDGTVRFWDPAAAAGGEEAAERGLLDGEIGCVDALAVSPDGNTLAAGGERDVVVWDADERAGR